MEDAMLDTEYGLDTHFNIGAFARTHQIIFDYLAKSLKIQKRRV